MKKWLYSICSFFSPVTKLVTPTFDHTHPKIFDQLLIFVIMCQHKKNQFIPSVHSSDAANFRVHQPDWPHPICLKMYQHEKKSVLSVLSWDTVKIRAQRLDWPHSFLTMCHQKFFNQFLIFVNLYQHVKNEAASLICSREMLDLKILQSEWLRAFSPLS